MSAASDDRPARWARHLPWIDGMAGLTAGVLMLTLRPLLVDFYGLSHQLLTVVGCVNIAYSGFGFSLGTLRPRPRGLLVALVLANLLWGAVCFVLAARALASATIWGVGQLLVEGTFVTTLALLEWRYRGLILEGHR